jgi:SAM-dependent methyltransferase
MVAPVKVPGTRMLTIAFILCMAIAIDALLPPGTGEGSANASSSKKMENKPKLDVGYQPTPTNVVEEMLKMADVRSDDLIYDLGCGDGRIVIMAATRKGAKGVGVDLDPERIKESMENARKAGVTDKVHFFQQDLFKTDIRQATVVMLYLWPEVNLRLRPKLFSELKPGTRVLSHNHDMGEWKPDRVTKLGKHSIYFWVIPADIAGTWTWPLQWESKTAKAVLRLNQNFQKITGNLTINKSTVPIAGAMLRGNQLNLSAMPEIDGKKLTIKLNGHKEGVAVLGTMEITGGAAKSTTPWKATGSAGQ